MLHDRDAIIKSLSKGLIVSCQPTTGGPFDSVDGVVKFSTAALSAGCHGLRIEGVDRVRAIAAITDLPIVGIVKRDLVGSSIRITPFTSDVEALAQAGAAIIAFDATHRNRPTEVAKLIERIHGLGCLAMADCSTFEEGLEAHSFGCDFVASTLSGYVGTEEPSEPDIPLVKRWSEKGIRVVAEGCYKTTEQASLALKNGAFAVTVGSAITRPEVITAWFIEAMTSANVVSSVSPLKKVEL